jgi:2-polyprenyl-6-methoxyphenol hydroxylase-like FAD-dependent oxidoreductase
MNTETTRLRTDVRRAEIAGAGLAGLTLASILAGLGWRVRVHERGSELREVGAGLFLWKNALTALRDAGALENVLSHGELAESWRLIDERGRELQAAAMDPARVELVASLRTVLHRSLVDAARQRGVEILLRSEVVGAHPDGLLRLSDGTDARADVVVGADGVGSVVREALGLTREREPLGSGGMRFLLTRADKDPVRAAFEYWKGSRVVGILPCSRDMIYVYFGVNFDDVRGRAAPLDRDTWTASFPRLEGVFRRIEGDGHWTAFESVEATAWSRGCAAIVGDAAHAMPPTLGQGACLAMANARALAHSLNDSADLRAALLRWEAAERPVTELTQRWSRLYLRVEARWPSALLDLRSVLVRWAGRSAWVQRRTTMAAMHEPALAGQV